MYGDRHTAFTVKDASKSKALVQRGLDSARSDVPQWLILEKDEMKGSIARLPLKEEIPVLADERMIVELYSK